MIKVSKEDFEQECEKHYLRTGQTPTKADLSKFGKCFSYSAALRVGFQLKAFSSLMSERHGNTKVTETSTCPHCSTEFTAKGKEQIYCSSRCAAFTTNANKEYIKKECIQCCQGFLAKQPHAKFCSSYCQGQYAHKVPASSRNRGKDLVIRKTHTVVSDNLPNVRKKLNFKTWLETGCYVPNLRLRGYLLQTVGYKCKCCGISEWQGKPITLEVEHIDGNSENCAVANICFLCPNCHSQTPTYRAKNKGNGRHLRRQRYAEGKSY